jgi:hypothetical protein
LKEYEGKKRANKIWKEKLEREEKRNIFKDRLRRKKRRMMIKRSLCSRG